MTETEQNYFGDLRSEMIEQIALHTTLISDKLGKGKLSARVIDAMAKVPRHEFVPAEMQLYAYLDSPLPIGYGKTISQPFIVALMTDLLDIDANDVILEIGTGLGYQAAILAELGQRVYTVELLEELAASADKTLNSLGYKNVEMRIGDGSQGWPEHSPFDKIIVTAAPELIPPSLLEQVRTGGKVVIPAGIEDSQMLMLLEKDKRGRFASQDIIPVRFSQLVTSH